MRKINNVLGLIVVIMLFIIFYLVVLYSIVFCLSLIPFFGVEIISWRSVFTFSIWVMLWIIPFEIISFLMDIRIKNKTRKEAIRLLTITLNLLAFTFFVIWLNSRIIGIQFSNIGVVSYIIIIALLVFAIYISGNRLKEIDNKNLKS